VRLGYVTLAELEPWLTKLGKSGYGDYVRRVALSPLAHSHSAKSVIVDPPKG
jgi:hypothetical protein